MVLSATIFTGLRYKTYYEKPSGLLLPPRSASATGGILRLCGETAATPLRMLRMAGLNSLWLHPSHFGQTPEKIYHIFHLTLTSPLYRLGVKKS